MMSNAEQMTSEYTKQLSSKAGPY